MIIEALKIGAKKIGHSFGYDIKMHPIAKGNVGNNPVCFVHIPKCGGMSIERGLRQQFAGVDELRLNRDALIQSTICRLDNKPNNLDGVAKFSDLHCETITSLLGYELAKGQKGFISGHVATTSMMLSTYASEVDFVTVLRDPIERFKSNYIFNKLTNRTGVMSPSALSETDVLQEAWDILNHRRGWQMANVPTMTIVGAFPSDKAHAVNLQKTFIANLKRYKVVGFLDDLTSFQSRIHEVLGKKVIFGHRNATASFSADENDKTRVQLTEFFQRRDVQHKLESLCEIEMQNYLIAKETFGGKKHE
ncbi:hypothetical protein [Pseudoalteromonas pernae]|uniref:hypothetical protein n=1 Tax=Pseudoalteromonas pernae TaxID=3118054 RepID=UPI003242BD00